LVHKRRFGWSLKDEAYKKWTRAEKTQNPVLTRARNPVLGGAQKRTAGHRRRTERGISSFVSVIRWEGGEN